MKKKKYVQKELFGLYSDYSLNEMVQLINEQVAGLPVESRESAKFSVQNVYFDPYQQDPSIQFCMTYERLETDEEEKKREDYEEKYRKEQEEREEAEFKRLSQKFQK